MCLYLQMRRASGVVAVVASYSEGGVGREGGVQLLMMCFSCMQGRSGGTPQVMQVTTAAVARSPMEFCFLHELHMPPPALRLRLLLLSRHALQTHKTRRPRRGARAAPRLRPCARSCARRRASPSFTRWPLTARTRECVVCEVLCFFFCVLCGSGFVSFADRDCVPWPLTATPECVVCVSCESFICDLTSVQNASAIAGRMLQQEGLISD